MIDLHGRAIRSRIDRWREAGLIDPATATRLLAFEASGGAPGIPVLMLIGAFSVGLGIVAIVSANWDAIPVWAKLGGHVLLNLALGAWGCAEVLKGHDAGERTREGLLMVLSASSLALLAHVGQSFQLQGSLFGLLATWLALVTPFTLAFARSAANRWLWVAGVFAMAGAGLAEHAEALEKAGLLGTAIALFIVAGYAAPLLARGRANAEPWGRLLNLAMLGTLVAMTSAAQMGWRLDSPLDVAERADVLTGTAVATLGLLAAHLAFARGIPERPWPAVFVVLSPAYAALPVVIGGLGSAAVAAVGFCLYWFAISQLAHAAGLIPLYRLAVVVIALRLLLVFVEAFGGLLLTGVGLIAGGAVLLAFGFVVRRILRRAESPASP
ncbi:DUF2157 domain-containing protein [Azospirillum soli]|uniref:DUF2157 domain-containing protein n=1 Tax=Azospirillum soli TaxID=1304799 RepID=UPI001AE62FA2|nr:DUF2157 domain-containing protein [Azospirillum soli]MBP2314404.1 MFS family permease [Azospirillum soli]